MTTAVDTRPVLVLHLARFGHYGGLLEIVAGCGTRIGSATQILVPNLS
jgi:hypothetical protein